MLKNGLSSNLKRRSAFGFTAGLVLLSGCLAPRLPPATSTCDPSQDISIEIKATSIHGGHKLSFSLEELNRVLNDKDFDLQSATLTMTVRGRNHSISDIAIG